MFYSITRMNWAFAGMTRVVKLMMFCVIYRVRYKLQTRSMLMDMKSMNTNGITRVNNIEELA